MAEFVTVGSKTDVTPGNCISVEIKGRGIALLNVNGTIYALDNTCPHAGGPLGEGTLDGEVIECPWHGWQFNVKTGERLSNPELTVECFSVRLNGDQIQVALPKE